MYKYFESSEHEIIIHNNNTLAEVDFRYLRCSKDDKVRVFILQYLFPRMLSEELNCKVKVFKSPYSLKIISKNLNYNIIEYNLMYCWMNLKWKSMYEKYGNINDNIKLVLEPITIIKSSLPIDVLKFYIKTCRIKNKIMAEIDLDNPNDFDYDHPIFENWGRGLEIKKQKYEIKEDCIYWRLPNMISEEKFKNNWYIDI